jgi:hypothetical protein
MPASVIAVLDTSSVEHIDLYADVHARQIHKARFSQSYVYSKLTHDNPGLEAVHIATVRTVLQRPAHLVWKIAEPICFDLI